MTARVRVRVSRQSGGLVQVGPKSPVTVQVTNVSQVGGGADRLDELEDVVEGVPQQGQVLVYDPNGDRYVVTDVDGGEKN